MRCLAVTFLALLIHCYAAPASKLFGAAFSIVYPTLFVRRRPRFTTVVGYLYFGKPSDAQKPITLFECPEKSICYASPRNCVDNCNAAFSMISPDHRNTVFNITMMSPLSYTALLIKDDGAEKYDKAVICSFHAPKGIVARVDFPEPIIIHQFIDTSEPMGHTDTTYTQCATNVSAPIPKKASFKLISGKWESELVLDENLGIDMVPAVENAKILSDAEKINIPSSNTAAVRSSESEEANDEKTSETALHLGFLYAAVCAGSDSLPQEQKGWCRSSQYSTVAFVAASCDAYRS
ncbi:unnamed protein product [Nippostrongylus brasiliensis]|uniref:ZP domain-containing protein n=1 Tax=Nippostrongylus brasiliensis TaxID=27835 RepID=A0A0N4Y1R4_NIPBR|nr:unnamed protein product [Nippostrongylus brasiliensis]